MTRRAYRRTPRPSPLLRVVHDDRIPMPRALEREVMVRDLMRRLTIAAFVVSVGGIGAVLALGVVATLRWCGR